jgi:hypothetical protein
MSMTSKTNKPPESGVNSKATLREKSQSQKERFIETAKKLEADESSEAFERAFAKIIPPDFRGKSQKKD